MLETLDQLFMNNTYNLNKQEDIFLRQYFGGGIPADIQ